MTNEEMAAKLREIEGRNTGMWPNDALVLRQIAAALEEKPLAEIEGWMTTVHFCGKKRLRPGESISGLVSGDKGKTRRPVRVLILPADTRQV